MRLVPSPDSTPEPAGLPLLQWVGFDTGYTHLAVVTPQPEPLHEWRLVCGGSPPGPVTAPGPWLCHGCAQAAGKLLLALTELAVNDRSLLDTRGPW